MGHGSQVGSARGHAPSFRILAALLVAVAVWLATPPGPAAAKDVYRINVGDQVEVDILDDREPPVQVLVGGEGDIQLPLIGGVTVAGLTVAQARQAVRDTYAEREIYRDPSRRWRKSPKRSNCCASASSSNSTRGWSRAGCPPAPPGCAPSASSTAPPPTSWNCASGSRWPSAGSASWRSRWPLPRRGARLSRERAHVARANVEGPASPQQRAGAPPRPKRGLRGGGAVRGTGESAPPHQVFRPARRRRRRPVRSAQNPVELLSRPAFGGIVTYLMTRYDVLLINAPPTTNLSDTLILAQHADATLFAVRSSAVPQKVIEAALTRLDEAGAFICGTVMTQVRRGHLAGREVYDYAYYRGVRAPAGCRARAGRPVPRARMPGRGRPRPRGMRGWRSTRPRSCCSRSGRR